MPGETNNHGIHNFQHVSSLEESDLQDTKSRSPDTGNLLPVSNMGPVATTSTQTKGTRGEPETVPLKKIKSDNVNLRSVSYMDLMETQSTETKSTYNSIGELEQLVLLLIWTGDQSGGYSQ